MWRHILVMHSRNNKGADFVDVRDPRDLKYLNTIDLDWNQSVEPGNNDLYAQTQDGLVFVRRAKLDMTGLLKPGGNASIALRFDITGTKRPAGSVGGAVGEVPPGHAYPNLLYYAMNVSPDDDEAKSVPQMVELRAASDGRQIARLMSRERVNDAGLEMILEVSDQPGVGWLAWNESPHQVTRVVVDLDVALDGTTQLVLYEVKSSANVLFFRMQVKNGLDGAV